MVPPLLRSSPASVQTGCASLHPPCASVETGRADEEDEAGAGGLQGAVSMFVSVVSAAVCEAGRSRPCRDVVLPVVMQ